MDIVYLHPEIYLLLIVSSPAREHKTSGFMLSPHKRLLVQAKPLPYNGKGYAMNFLRNAPTNPSKPSPNNEALAGSGTAGPKSFISATPPSMKSTNPGP